MITINGTDREDLAGPISVRALLDVLAIDADARGVAVAVDATVVPRSAWPTASVPDAARVEVLVAVQGG